MDAETPDYPMPPQELPAEPAATDRAQARERILRRFERWLDEILDDEQPPEGVAVEILAQLESDAPLDASGPGGPACDSYALWSAVTALTEETRLQGRAFKQLREGLTPMQDLVGSVGDMLGRHEAALDRRDQSILETTRQAAWGEILDTLIDMRERLLRGAQSTEAWLERADPQESGLAVGLREKIFGRRARGKRRQNEAVRSLLTGYALCREVLDEALARIGVRPLDCLGRPFDPSTMKAIDIGYDADAPDGTVLEVYRQGYRRDEAVYRPAQVKVARRRGGTQNPPFEQGERA